MKKWERVSILASIGVVLIGVVSLVLNELRDKKPTAAVNVSGEKNVVTPFINQGNINIVITDKYLKEQIEAFKKRGEREKIPKDSKECFKKAISHLLKNKQGKVNLIEAINSLGCSLKSYPTSEAYNLMGRCYSLLREHQKALKNFQKGKALYKKHQTDKKLLTDIEKWIKKTEKKIIKQTRKKHIPHSIKFKKNEIIYKHNLILSNTVWYKDEDDDRYSDGTTKVQATRPMGYKLPSELAGNKFDCNDNKFNINPDAKEICNDNIDQDCDKVDLKCLDYQSEIRTPVATITRKSSFLSSNSEKFLYELTTIVEETRTIMIMNIIDDRLKNNVKTATLYYYSTGPKYKKVPMLPYHENTWKGEIPISNSIDFKYAIRITKNIGETISNEKSRKK